MADRHDLAPAPEGIAIGEDGLARCWWAEGDPLNRTYHDTEWGRPVADDRRLFEKFCLEGFQSGLSWLTILRKRPNFRRAFADFDTKVVAGFDDADIERLMADTGIVRNRAKIAATINNARRCPDLVDEFGSFAAYVWRYEPDRGARAAVMDRPALLAASTSPESVALSKDLRKRGWAFVGPTTAYAAMQSMGLVNDHLGGCHVRDEVEAERTRFVRPRPPTTPRGSPATP
jgi:DNA-3-methyladenine glycosylase I